MKPSDRLDSMEWLDWERARGTLSRDFPDVDAAWMDDALDEAARLGGFLVVDLDQWDGLAVERSYEFLFDNGVMGSCTVDLVAYRDVDGVLKPQEIFDWKRVGSLSPATVSRYARSLQPHWYMHAVGVRSFRYRLFQADSRKPPVLLPVAHDEKRVREAATAVAYWALGDQEPWRNPDACWKCPFTDRCWGTEESPIPSGEERRRRPWPRSEVENLMSCPRKGLWSYQRGRDVQTSDEAPLRGSLLHGALAELYLQALLALDVEVTPEGIFDLRRKGD